MTPDQAALHLAELVRKYVWSPHSELRHTTRAILKRALQRFDDARKRRTGFERLLDDDGDDLPGAKVATPTLPACKFCNRQYRPKKSGQKFCSTACRKAAYYARQRRIRHQDTPPEPVLGKTQLCVILDDD